jgi:3-mercaptopyruvate sulfurtransferase SseA
LKIKRKGLLLALAGVLLLLPLGMALGAEQKVKYVNAETLKGMLGDPQVMIIDVRTPKDWADSDRKIKGAVRQVPDRAATWGKALPQDKKVILY